MRFALVLSLTLLSLSARGWAKEKCSRAADVTSVYWESEAVLVVHDRGFAQAALFP